MYFLFTLQTLPSIQLVLQLIGFGELLDTFRKLFTGCLGLSLNFNSDVQKIFLRSAHLAALLVSISFALLIACFRETSALWGFFSHSGIELLGKWLKGLFQYHHMTWELLAEWGRTSTPFLVLLGVDKTKWKIRTKLHIAEMVVINIWSLQWGRGRKCDSVEKERKANVWLCHQNEGEDGYGAVLFTWPLICLYVEKNVSSTNGHCSAVSGSWQPARFVEGSHLCGEVFRSDAKRYVCHYRRFCFLSHSVTPNSFPVFFLICKSDQDPDWNYSDSTLSQLLKERVT